MPSPGPFHLAALPALAVLACATPRVTLEPGPPRRPLVERLSPGELRVRWPAEFGNGGVRVFVAHSPEALRRGRALGVAKGTEVTLLAKNGDDLGIERRLYFELAPEDGAARVVAAERRVPLAGTDNTRDLGGYETAGGRHVRWGVLYRSNDLSSLRRGDLEALAELGVSRIYDFRSEAERKSSPNRRSNEIELVQLPVSEMGIDPSKVRMQILTGGIAQLGMARTMEEAYRRFVTDHGAAWSALLRDLARPDLAPALFHCTAGKDRTGFAAALVLLALRVPRETVLEDYLLSNRYRERFDRRVLRWVPLVSLFRTRAEDMRPLLEARPEYLEAAFEVMDEEYGGVDGYLERGLGVDARLREQLEANLLR